MENQTRLHQRTNGRNPRHDFLPKGLLPTALVVVSSTALALALVAPQWDPRADAWICSLLWFSLGYCFGICRFITAVYQSYLVLLWQSRSSRSEKTQPVVWVTRFLSLRYNYYTKLQINEKSRRSSKIFPPLLDSCFLQERFLLVGLSGTCIARQTSDKWHVGMFVCS